MLIDIVQADYSNEGHSKDIVSLLDHYAEDVMGGGEKLSSFVKNNLVDRLRNISSAFSILCYVDGTPAGLANCFESFSTFKCKPLINIHDIVVKKDFRGKKISQKMLGKIESIASEREERVL